MQNMLKATPTMWQLLQTMQVQNNVLPTKSQNMHLHTRAQNRGSHNNQIFTERLGRATIGPSGAELDGEGETEQVPVHKSHQRGTHRDDSVRHYASEE